MLRSAAGKIMWRGRTTVSLVGLIIVTALVVVCLLAPPALASSTFTVDSIDDAGDADPDGVCDSCTLREAIQEANANGNPAEVDRIDFDISGTGVHTISPTTALPVITEPVVIDGYSQPGSSANTLSRGTNAKLLVEIDGTNAFGADGRLGGLGIAASNSAVRGLVINGFKDTLGVEVSPYYPDDLLTNVRIRGNFIGTDPSGTVAHPNDGGVELFATSNSAVGGTSLASRNIISANEFCGVFIRGGATNFRLGNSNNNAVRGNLIGTQKDAIKPLGNGAEGVVLYQDATGDRVLSNSIFSNGDLGIDLGDDGPTANDPGDTDEGPNGLQNKPVLSSAKTVSGLTTIQGELDGLPGYYTVQFFSNPSGNEGRTFIGQKLIKIEGSTSGAVAFTFNPAKAVAAGRRVTATATGQATGDTSEFSAPNTVVSS